VGCFRQLDLVLETDCRFWVVGRRPNGRKVSADNHLGGLASFPVRLAISSGQIDPPSIAR
jgi:hypothetical protein